MGKQCWIAVLCCFDLWFINPENPLIYAGVSSNKIEHGLSYDNHAQAMTISKSWIYWGIVEEQRFEKRPSHEYL
jgi:hypothetical protein